jgi:hypothetical protein
MDLLRRNHHRNDCRRAVLQSQIPPLVQPSHRSCERHQRASSHRSYPSRRYKRLLIIRHLPSLPRHLQLGYYRLRCTRQPQTTFQHGTRERKGGPPHDRELQTAICRPRRPQDRLAGGNAQASAERAASRGATPGIVHRMGRAAARPATQNSRRRRLCFPKLSTKQTPLCF